MRYSILDPTGNVTALVESAVPVERQPACATGLMARHPEVEQVGFVRFGDGGCVAGGVSPAVTRDGSDPLLSELLLTEGLVVEGAGPSVARDDPGPSLPELRMAGGEFCGNATMSAAALYALRVGLASGAEEPALVRMRVSGAAEPVAVELRRRGGDAFDARVRMPRAQEICEVELSFAGFAGTLPLVRMEGISHLVVERGSVFAGLRDVPVAAERAACAWCGELGCDGLGLMFVSEGESGWQLAPLVFVPASGTIFWEHSCASGSSAVGMYCAERAGSCVVLELHEPGGTLRVESDPSTGETWLSGSVRLQASYES